MNILPVFFGSMLLILGFLFTGCDDGGESDDTQSSSSASTQIEQTDCSGATFEGFNAEEIAEIVENAEEGADVVIEETTPPADDFNLGQQTRTFRVTFVQGCNNTVVNNDNDNISVDNDSTENP